MTPFDFEKEVIVASQTQPVLVDFWAEWCGPCRVLGPVLDKLAAAPGAGFRLVKVNVDEHQQLAMRFRVASIPAVKLFIGGEVAGEFVGALPEAEIKRFLQAHLPSESRELVARAKAGIARGEDVTALLEEAVAKDAEAYEARVLLAGQLFAKDLSTALALLGAVPKTEPASDVAQLILDLADLVARAERGVPSDVDPKERELWQRYFDGALLAKRGDYAHALETWVELVKRTRKLDDDGPRKAAVALMTMLGDEHPLTQAWRRPLTMALY